jgi:dTDP-4-amino-4,6-dideoxygalactose transaminase
VVVEVDAALTGIERDDLVHLLHAENVIARRYFYPGVHRMEPYRSAPSPQPHLQVTDSVCRRVMVLPTGESVQATDIERICELIAEAIDLAPEIREKFGHLPLA